MTTPIALTIAGSDSSGGAGIQADLKTFAAFGVYGASVITALTAQNTRGVSGVHPVPPAFITAQMDAVFDDLDVKAVKIGMVAQLSIIEAVAAALTRRTTGPVVLDPVMVAESGTVLLDDDARDVLVARLLPLTTVATPNIPEARALCGLGEEATQEELARAVVALGPRAAVVTGGHSEEVVDVFCEGGDVVEIPGERHPDGAAHGSGCTHSSTLAAYLAHGATPLEAARKARRVTSAAVGAGLRDIGKGPGPVDVFNLTAEPRQ